MKDVNSGEVTLLYNAKDCISGLKTPIVKDEKVTNISLLIVLVLENGLIKKH